MSDKLHKALHDKDALLHVDGLDDYPTDIGEDFRDDIIALMKKHGFGEDWRSMYVDYEALILQLYPRIDGHRVTAHSRQGDLTYNVTLPYGPYRKVEVEKQHE